MITGLERVDNSVKTVSVTTICAQSFQFIHVHIELIKCLVTLSTCCLLQYSALSWTGQMLSTQPAWSRPWWLLLGDCLISTCLSRAMANWISSEPTRPSPPTNHRPGTHMSNVWISSQELLTIMTLFLINKQWCLCMIKVNIYVLYYV